MGKRIFRTDRNHDLKISTNIIVDYLSNAKYEVILPFDVGSPCIRRILPFMKNDGEQASTLFLVNTKQEFPTKNGPSPFVLFLEKNEQISENEINRLLKLRSKLCIVRATEASQSMNSLASDIQGCFLSVEEFAFKSALGLSSQKPLQTIINIAEKMLNQFISVVDCNYMLLAYTKNIEPIDEINRKLIELGYHSDEILSTQRHDDYLSEEIKHQNGAKEYPASNRIPCALITAPLFLHQRYAGLVVMTTGEEKFTLGQKDLFEMLIGFCTMALKRNVSLPASQGEPDQEFLLHLISIDTLDEAYIHRQMTLLGIPTTGIYQLALIEINSDMSSQVGFILNEIRSIKDTYALPAVFEGSIVVLLNAQRGFDIAQSMETLLTSKAGDYLEHIYESELFDDYRSINVAYQSLLVERKYAPLSAAPLWEKEIKETKITTFSEVFTFIMIDPEVDSAVKYFAASNTIIERILINDAEKKTNDFELLAAYLSKGDRASRIADCFHLHRNGVAYRIERIQNQFNINLENPVSRNYAQMAIFCKMVTDPECARKILGDPQSKPGSL